MSDERQAAGPQEQPAGLTDALRNLAGAMSDQLMARLGQRVDALAERLAGYADDGDRPAQVAAKRGAERLSAGDSPISALAKAGLTGGRATVERRLGGQGTGTGGGEHGGRAGGGAGGGGRDLKVTNIVETIDIGAPVRVVYNQWTQFKDFPSFMKKVEHVEQKGDEKLTWKAQVLWSHRTWESAIIEQVPEERIVWRSKGAKGSVDGTVTFHELTPDLTRVVLVLMYHPQGFFERTGNLWRAQGRRVRLELKHFARHVMTETILDPDQVEGWRGEIRDGQVVQDHESARREECAER